MMKKLLLSAMLLAGTLFTSAQVSVELLSYPTEFALVSGTTYGPSSGEPACVFKVNNMPSATLIFSPIMPKATLDTRMPQASGETLTGNGAGNIGTCFGLHNVAPDAMNPRVINFTDNGDGTETYIIAATRFNIATTPDEVTEYAPNFRYFGQIFFSPVIDVAGTIEIAGMKFSSTATAEDEATLLSAAATLSSDEISRVNISGSISPNPVSGILTVAVEGVETYTLMNAVGQTVLTQAATGSIDVSGLASGLYILVTEKGTAKVIVE